MNDKVFASALACFFLLPGTILFAQQAPDIFSGNPDVLYAVSQLLRSIDQFWFAPLSPSVPVAPLAASSPSNPISCVISEGQLGRRIQHF